MKSVKPTRLSAIRSARASSECDPPDVISRAYSTVGLILIAASPVLVLATLAAVGAKVLFLMFS